MCSVFGCDSWRRSAQRFKLPDDPEKRLEWVQFLGTVNKQRFKESSWTDITICSEHFKDDCFVKLTKDAVQLKPCAVPSLKSDFNEPEPNVQSPACVETVGASSSSNEESGQTSQVAQEITVQSGVFCSADISDSIMSVLSENHKCPLCGGKLQMKKFTHGLLIVLDQQCLQCEYRNEWKSQVNASVPTTEDQHLTGGIEVTLESHQTEPTDDNHSIITDASEINAVIDEESDPMDETEQSSQSDMDSDEEWRSKGMNLLRNKLPNDSDEQSERDDDEVNDHSLRKNMQLCTECGMFFSKRWPHTCEHKTKPFSCNICGKRCVSEAALNTHGRTHEEDYEFRCKFCTITFRTKADKLKHEQIHITEGRPYKCRECSETFASRKERSIHLETHTKCHICGIEFRWPLNLQRHLAIHTGEKPYKCSVCQRGFNQAGHLKSHMRLHTGERPFKCQHCDKSFNHNVSLKSHVQRYHTAGLGLQQKKGKIRESNTAQEDGNKRGTDSGVDNQEEEQDERKTGRSGGVKFNKYKRSTGRPIGRPKRPSSDNFTEEDHVGGRGSNAKTGKIKRQKLKKAQRRDKESENDSTNSDTDFHSAEEDEERSRSVKKSTSRSGRRPKHSDNDSDFDPEERKKKTSQKRGMSTGRRRGRPRKALEV